MKKLWCVRVCVSPVVSNNMCVTVRLSPLPASSFEHFHNSFPGGYIDHVLRVTRNAIQMYELQKEWGIDMKDLTKESVIFTALHHDLGKLGTVEEDYYIKNDSEWHVKNQGKIYWFDGTTWQLTQEKTTVNQAPMFELFDETGISYTDTTNYSNSSFRGNKVFSYQEGVGANDPEL